MLKAGVEISIIYTDEHLIELRIAASNRAFAGRVEVYAASNTLADMAEVLRGFPSGEDDFREYEIGSLDNASTSGGAGFRFYCLDSLGHASVEVKLRSEPGARGGVNDTVVLNIAVEAALLDSFVAQLAGAQAEVGQSASPEAAA